MSKLDESTLEGATTPAKVDSSLVSDRDKIPTDMTRLILGRLKKILEAEDRKSEHATMLEKLRTDYADILELLSDKDWLDVSNFHHDLSSYDYPEGMDINCLRRELDKRKADGPKFVVLRRYSLKTYDDSEGLGDWRRIEGIGFKLINPSQISRLKDFLNLNWQVQNELGFKRHDSEDDYYAVTDEIPAPEDVEEDFKYRTPDNKLEE